MPFMIGSHPIRRTVKYLEQGKLYLKNSIQIFAINYSIRGDHHRGTKDFIYWFLPQIQYKNPNVQCITFKNMTPSPFITCFYDNGKKMIIDTDGKNKLEILNHLSKVVGKDHKELEKEAIQSVTEDNPANFGIGCRNSCMCTKEGQLPCPAIVPLPDFMRGRFYFFPKE